MKYQLGAELFELLPNGQPDGWSYSLAGQSGVASAVEVEPGTYSVLVAGRSYEVQTGPLPDGLTWVEVNGRRRELEIQDPRTGRAAAAAAGRAGQAILKAPMPGKVVRILVREGEAVEAGQGVVVVEAMKMQNEMKAPRAGVVKSIQTKEGSTVAAGEALLVIE